MAPALFECTVYNLVLLYCKTKKDTFFLVGWKCSTILWIFTVENYYLIHFSDQRRSGVIRPVLNKSILFEKGRFSIGWKLLRSRIQFCESFHLSVKFNRAWSSEKTTYVEKKSFTFSPESEKKTEKNTLLIHMLLFPF